MRAVIYHGRHDMRVETVDDPRIEEPTDVLLRVTATAICGSDLHIYNGWMMPFMRSGDVMGHEFMGVIEAVGSAVERFKVGDRVVVPFAIACGNCFFCLKELYSQCERTNPDSGSALNRKDLRPPAALYGYSHLYGGIAGGQAEYVRVLRADENAFPIADDLTDDQVIFLSDIFPTGFQAAVNGGVEAGSTVAIFGAGPVGLMTALSCRLLGADRIFMVDDHLDRLAFAAEHYGAIPIDMNEVEDPAARIVEATDRRGVDAVIDAVGFEAKGNKLESTLRALAIETGSGAVLRQGIAAARRGGVLSVAGVYVGYLQGFLLGDAFDKGLTFRMGQTHVHRYLNQLLGHIRAGAHPGEIISHRLSLEEAPHGYDIFSKAEEQCRKVVLYPGRKP